MNRRLLGIIGVVALAALAVGAIAWTQHGIGISSARESARIQFERDISLAQAELGGASELMQRTNQRAHQMNEFGGASLAMLDQQLSDLQLAGANLQQKRARVDFLRSEAKRLHISVTVPLSDAERPEPPTIVKAQPTAAAELAITESFDVVPTVPLPEFVTLTGPVEVRDRTSYQVLKFASGRQFRVVGSRSDAVVVRYLDHELEIPTVSTDLQR